MLAWVRPFSILRIQEDWPIYFLGKGVRHGAVSSQLPETFLYSTNVLWVFLL